MNIDVKLLQDDQVSNRGIRNSRSVVSWKSYCI